MTDVNRQMRLAAHPKGEVRESDFALHESTIPQPAEGEVLVKILYLSVDPAMRVWITGRRTYVDGVQVGEIMPGSAVAQVIESRKEGFEPGELVVGVFGWQEYATSNGQGLMRMTKIPPGVPPTAALGSLGINGLTAYFGLLDVGRPEPGQTVVVSGAAGATGGVAGQIARIKGCRVVGIAGGSGKCQWLTDEARFDAAIDYKSEDLGAGLKELCPGGIDVFFDNVGGEVLEAVLDNLAPRARIALCGAISTYNLGRPQMGPRNYMNLLVARARMEGFVVLDYARQFATALGELAMWKMAGELVDREDVLEGLELAPRALIRLFTGQNQGKQLVKVAEPTSA